ncbi:hypothetical protein KCP77_16715 [Salmonella enterica subsp. enterica]|nr:hypothetical protein KCP77_16715 [Salmonella enterica subsp. enterica]
MDDIAGESRRARCEVLFSDGDDAAGVSPYARELVGKRDVWSFSCGVHPLNRDEAYDVEELRLLAAEDDVVAMGETGEAIDTHA